MTEQRHARRHRLGTDGPEVGVQGLGCMGMSFGYGPTTPRRPRPPWNGRWNWASRSTTRPTPTARGENERSWRRSSRPTAKRSSSPRRSSPCRSCRRTRPGGSSATTRPYIRQAVEGEPSRRLDLDAIDLYYMHRRDVNVPIEETVGVMADLVREGKVKHLGLSEVTGEELRAARTCT